MENDNKGNFKTVKNSNYLTFDKKDNKRGGFSFGKTVAIPFISGIVGCAVVLGACFGIPSIKSKIFGKNTVSQVPNISASTENSRIC